jgi:hypothetical protein
MVRSAICGALEALIYRAIRKEKSWEKCFFLRSQTAFAMCSIEEDRSSLSGPQDGTTTVGSILFFVRSMTNLVCVAV